MESLREKQRIRSPRHRAGDPARLFGAEWHDCFKSSFEDVVRLSFSAHQACNFVVVFLHDCVSSCLFYVKKLSDEAVDPAIDF